jgi:hypothetical protein
MTLSGLVWLTVGVSLLMMGLNFLMEGANAEVTSADSFPLLNSMRGVLGSVEQGVVVLVALGLIIGYFKGKFVLGKSAKQGIARIQSFSNPTALSNIYSAKYYVLLGIMIGLGMSMKHLGIPADVRGLVDVAVGSALINGSMYYFRACFAESCTASHA